MIRVGDVFAEEGIVMAVESGAQGARVTVELDATVTTIVTNQPRRHQMRTVYLTPAQRDALLVEWGGAWDNLLARRVCVAALTNPSLRE